MSIDRLAALRLARSHGVGPRLFARLMRRHGEAGAALRHLPPRATLCPEAIARAELRAGEAMGGLLLLLGEANYPLALRQIPDPPPALWALGDLALTRRNCVALVGARNASAQGRALATELAAGLGAAGWAVVSGLARGIDAAAHEAALANGTIACVAGGVDVAYPPQNAALRARIAQQGLILSENPPGAPPQARHFPRRNRIISGLARGVVLVEAAARSGSLITARCAAEQGREAMAVPGSPREPRAAGCNALIREGAALIRDTGDVLEALAQSRFQPRQRAAPRPASRPADPASDPGSDPAAPAAEGLLGLLGDAPIHVDALARAAGMSAQALSAALIELELDELIERRPGDMVARAG